MKPTRRDYSTLIIWSALAVTVTRYAGAFVASDAGEITGGWSTALTILMAISGVGMGFLDVLGLAYVFDGWRTNLPKAGASWSNRFKVLTGFVLLLVVTGLGILTPFTVARISAETMAETLTGAARWLWSLAVNLAPFLIIGGTIFSQAGFVTVSKDSASTVQALSTSQKNQSMHIQASSMYVCRKCGKAFETVPALASHARWVHSNGKAAKGD